MRNSFFRILSFIVIMALILPGSAPAAAQPAAPAANSISGKVTDGSGNPVAGVTVTARLNSYPIILVHGFRGYR